MKKKVTLRIISEKEAEALSSSKTKIFRDKIPHSPPHAIKRDLLFENLFLPFFNTNKILYNIYNKASQWGPSIKDGDFFYLWSFLFPDIKIEYDKEIKWLFWKNPIRYSSLQDASAKLKKLKSKSKEAGYRILEINKKEYVIYSQAVYYFIVVQHPAYWETTVKQYQVYYKDYMPKVEHFYESELVEFAIMRAILRCNLSMRVKYFFQITQQQKRRLSHVWGSFFEADVLERFKEELWIAIKCPYMDFGEIKNASIFAKNFEAQWIYAKQFSDLEYNFSVIPRFSLKDMVRYAVFLPNEIKDDKIVYEMIDYVGYKVCPSLRLDIHRADLDLFKGWIKVFLQLCIPLIQAKVNWISKQTYELRKTTIIEKEKQELQEKIIPEIKKWILHDFDFSYRKVDYPVPFFMPIGNLSILDKKRKIGNTKEQEDAFVYWVRPSFFIVKKLKSLYKSSEEEDEEEKKKKRRVTGIEDLLPNAENETRDSLDLVAKTDVGFNDNDEMVYSSVGTDKVTELPDERFIEFKGKKYVPIKRLARDLGYSTQTLRNWEQKGLIKFKKIWINKKRLDKRWGIRVIPYEQYVKIIKSGHFKNIGTTYQEIAEIMDISSRHLRRLKKKYKIDSLPIYKQKQALGKILLTKNS